MLRLHQISSPDAKYKSKADHSNRPYGRTHTSIKTLVKSDLMAQG